MYYKFNNSRSEKQPFFVYLKMDDGSFKDATGSYWSITNTKDLISISQEEYENCEKSNELSKDMKIGDNAVVIEFVAMKERYGKITNINGDIIVLDDKKRWYKNEIRNADILIHKN